MKILFELVNRGMNKTFDSQHVWSGSAGGLHPSTRVLACLKRQRYIVAELRIFNPTTEPSNFARLVKRRIWWKKRDTLRVAP